MAYWDCPVSPAAPWIELAVAIAAAHHLLLALTIRERTECYGRHRLPLRLAQD